MADEQVTPPVVVQGNDPSVRTETGEIKDQQTKQPDGTANQEPLKKSDTSAESTEKSVTTESEKKPEGEKKTETAKGPPEKYEFKAPEGYEIDAKVVDEATPIFKELGLTNEQAQKLFDLYSKNAIATADAAYKQYEATRQGWRNDVIKDTTLGDGKEGLKPEVRANIDKAFQALGDQKVITAFKEAMDLTGVGDNPVFVAAMNAWGKLLSEGTPVRGAGPSSAGQRAPGSGPASAAAAMYPNLPTSSRV